MKIEFIAILALVLYIIYREYCFSRDSYNQRQEYREDLKDLSLKLMSKNVSEYKLGSSESPENMQDIEDEHKDILEMTDEDIEKNLMI